MFHFMKVIMSGLDLFCTENSDLQEYMALFIYDRRSQLL